MHIYSTTQNRVRIKFSYHSANPPNHVAKVAKTHYTTEMDVFYVSATHQPKSERTGIFNSDTFVASRSVSLQLGNSRTETAPLPFPFHFGPSFCRQCVVVVCGSVEYYVGTRARNVARVMTECVPGVGWMLRRFCLSGK